MPIKKKIICFIFARKNSKRLPKKNTLKIGKLMLVEHTILSAIKSKVFDKIILSSDDEKILNLSINYQKNKNLEKVISEAKPPIFWKDKEITKKQISLWPPKKIKEFINNNNKKKIEQINFIKIFIYIIKCQH